MSDPYVTWSFCLLLALVMLRMRNDIVDNPIHRCPQCGTKTGDHDERCSWR